MMPACRIMTRLVMSAIGGALGLSALAGCASFPDQRLPRYTDEQIVPGDAKPSIDYDVKVFLSEEEYPAAAVPGLQKRVDHILGRSRLFSNVRVRSVAETGNKAEPYHLSITIRDESRIKHGIWGGLAFAVTVMIFPLQIDDDFVLLVDVTEGGQVIKHYEYRDAMETWVELFLIVMTPTHSQPAVTRAVLENMLMNFLHDLAKDKILTGGATGTG